ncbi:uncharacterized protein LOC108905425 isoform X2 [Anoplophora glabripennis]|uniref:uncharacterized protein LOC108905425 isoform X2 n=1 Tax=Anoplophora glabripennis TaxID=217634 RepID=UPI0008747884|nr:uncharacterized protein LOC108905425 isoform X2 [Anoplophora glabripennis]
MSWQAVVLGISAVLWGQCGASGKDDLDFTTVDVARLATHAYGTEIVLLENTYKDQTAYRFEDFFWTGSGDGASDDEENWSSESTTTTVYKTKTVLSTVFIESPHSPYNETGIETTTKCSHDCEAPLTPEGQISPSPTLTSTTEFVDEGEDFFDADRQFWLLTVLKSDGRDPVIIDLKNSLAKLYKTAFQRQQERHLGINGRIKRDVEDKPVNVYIHKVNTSKTNGDNKIEVLYHVSVDGKPVSAITAANDMTLVSDEEVRQELGYPFVIKAEPYLKPSEPQSLSRARNTWIFIGVSIIGLLIFLLVVAFLTLGLTKRKRVGTPVDAGTDNRRHIFERGVGQDRGLVRDEQKVRAKADSPTYINFKNDNSTLTRSVVATSRPESSISSTSSSSGSLDISPLMVLNKKRRTPPKKPPRPKGAINKTAPINLRKIPPEVFDSDSSVSRKESPDAVFLENYDPGVISPKSYLSMPSVKSFPRGNMPEPLNKVLEPVSVQNLDMPDEEEIERNRPDYRKQGLIRHGSVGAVEDPGVIGPIVWNMHCQRLHHGVSVDEGIDDLKVASNMSRMRKRFHDLLDDTFSLFGSRRNSPVDYSRSDQNIKPTPIEVKSHSAANTSDP